MAVAEVSRDSYCETASRAREAPPTEHLPTCLSKYRSQLKPDAPHPASPVPNRKPLVLRALTL